MGFNFGIEKDGALAAIPPGMQMVLFSEGATINLAVGLAAELGIADLLADGPRSSKDIADATSTHPDSVYRLLRLLSSFGVFSEAEPGQFMQTQLSELLRSEAPGSLRSWMRMASLPIIWQTFAEALHSVKTGEAAFTRVSGGIELFDYLASHPRQSAMFNEGMTAFAQDMAAAVVSAYDFSGCQNIVDVGGGHGTLVGTILRAHSHLHGILFDQPHVVEGARSTLAAFGVADRCEIVGGDFFKSVPPGGDAYVLSWILHDWNNDRAVAILRSCRQAMDLNGRLLIIESVIPGGDEPHLGKIMDFVMLVAFGGQERTEAQYADLLREAGFTLSQIVPTPAPMSIIEATPA